MVPTFPVSQIAIVMNTHPVVIKALPMNKRMAPITLTAVNLLAFWAMIQNDSLAPLQKLLL
jgi:hypothetical protein